jgi:hypothetical protein
MKKTEIVINIDPLFFGDETDTQRVESFTFNLIKNIEKFYRVKCDYTLNYTGNSYFIQEDNPQLQFSISEFIENNWHSIPPVVAYA